MCPILFNKLTNGGFAHSLNYVVKRCSAKYLIIKRAITLTSCKDPGFYIILFIAL